MQHSILSLIRLGLKASYLRLLNFPVFRWRVLGLLSAIYFTCIVGLFVMPDSVIACFKLACCFHFVRTQYYQDI